MRDQTPLHTAAGKGSLEVARLSLDAGAERNSRMENGQTPLHCAVLTANLGVATNIETDYGCTALHFAAQNGQMEVVSLLLIARAEKNLANRSGETALHLAVSNGNLEILRLLLAAGVEIDAVAWDLAMEWPDVKRLFRLLV